jgi:nicotinamidase-related amidase/ketosteroid isomerase-like protein
MHDDTPATLLNAFVQAFSRLDLESMLACFADDATAFFPAEHEANRLQGKEAIRPAFGAVIERLRDRGVNHLPLEPVELKLDEQGGSVVATFHLEGDTLGRRTFVLCRTGTDWRIVHLHASNARASECCGPTQLSFSRSTPCGPKKESGVEATALQKGHGPSQLLRQPALVLIDIQRDFWRPLANAPHAASFPANVRGLLDLARANGWPVLHTHAEFKPDGSDWLPFYTPDGRGTIPCIAGTEGAEAEDFALPLPGEPIFRKQCFDGFVSGDLEAELRKRQVKTLLLAGLLTSVCVLFTASAAYGKGFVPILVADACADTPERHGATLRHYGDLCFQTMAAKEVERIPSDSAHSPTARG